VEKDLFPAAGKGNMAFISEAMLSSNKGGVGILFGDPIHIHIRKALER
jgi:hypothetical protein